MAPGKATSVAQQESHMRDGTKQRNVRQKWKHKVHRRKLYQTMGISGAFLSLGTIAGQIGPTLLDLQIITNTDLEQASAFVSSGAIGLVCGTFLCGLLHGKISGHLMIFLGVVLSGVVTILTPFCSNYHLMIAIRFVVFFALAFVSTSGNTLQMSLWGPEGDQLMQFIQFAFAFGGVLSPLYTEPFLAPRLDQHEMNTNESIVMNISSNYVSNSTDFQTIPRETNVKYAFIISGVLTLFSSIPFLPFYFTSRKKSDKKKHEEKRNQRKLPKVFIFFSLVMIWTVLMSYVFIETTFSGFLMTFLVREYESVSKSKAAVTTAIYWACFAAGRFSMVFLSRVLSSVQLLTICMSCMILTFTLFLVMAQLRFVDGLVVLSAIVGLSVSGVYASVLSMVESEIVTISGYIAGSLLFFSAVGGVINPLIMGPLMENFSNMWFCYLTLALTIVMSVTFAILLIFSRVYLSRRFGPCHSVVNEDIYIENSFLKDGKDGLD